MGPTSHESDRPYVCRFPISRNRRQLLFTPSPSFRLCSASLPSASSASSPPLALPRRYNNISRPRPSAPFPPLRQAQTRRVGSVRRADSRAARAQRPATTSSHHYATDDGRRSLPDHRILQADRLRQLTVKINIVN